MGMPQQYFPPQNPQYLSATPQGALYQPGGIGAAGGGKGGGMPPPQQPPQVGGKGGGQPSPQQPQTGGPGGPAGARAQARRQEGMQQMAPWMAANPGATRDQYMQAQDAWAKSPQMQQYQQQKNQAFQNWWANAPQGQRAAYINGGASLGVSGLSNQDINNYSLQGSSSGLNTYGAADTQALAQSLGPVIAGLGAAPTMPSSFTGAETKGGAASATPPPAAAGAPTGQPTLQPAFVPRTQGKFPSP
jgi:hypothetical protein